MSDLSFNVLTDRWIPLDEGGRANYSSVAELLCGERDAADLVHPRDDCRFFARMLLSALAQALWPARDARELRERIARPLERAVVDRRVTEVQGDFDLGGPAPFLQEPSIPATASGDNNTANLLHDVRHDLFRPATPCDEVCRPCAVLALYGIQSFATAGGRGYSPGVRGRPPVTTLVAADTVRSSVWANTLSEQTAASLGYPHESPKPWGPARQTKVGEAIALSEGLFWQPRALRFVPSLHGTCACCGATGQTVTARGFAAKSKVAGGFFRHPWSPSWEDQSPRAKRRFGFRNLPSDRPSWTGLVDLVAETRGVPDRRGRLTHPAPVVRQWTERVDLDGAVASLLVLDYASDKARIVSRTAESFPLSARLAAPDVADDVQLLVARAEEALDELRRALKRVHDKNTKKPRDGYWVADVTSTFWAITEEPFWRAYEARLREDEAPALELLPTLRDTALTLFDRATAASLGDPARLARMVRERALLSRRLRLRLTPAAAGDAADSRERGTATVVPAAPDDGGQR